MVSTAREYGVERTGNVREEYGTRESVSGLGAGTAATKEARKTRGSKKRDMLGKPDYRYQRVLKEII